MKPNHDHPVHFIGIGGSGMSPLADLSLQKGICVSGSDNNPSKTTQKLISNGAVVSTSHRAENIPENAIVVYSSAISENNEELLAARKSQNVVLHRSKFLASLMESKKAITVAGTHGKTTTAALIFHIMDKLEHQPSAVIGANLFPHDRAGFLGSGDYFIAETDESDGSLNSYSPFIAILTDVGNDHLEYFGSIEKIKQEFADYLKSTHPEGGVISYWDGLDCREVALTYQGNRLAFGKSIGSNTRLLGYQSQHGRLQIQAMIEKTKLTIDTPMVGYHNVMNILAALCVVETIEGDLMKAAKSLSSFRGIHRRCNLLYTTPNLKIYDDYAHNPGKIKACIAGIKESWVSHRIVVIFEPHRYSRLKTMYNELLGSFINADLVYVTPVYAAGEMPVASLQPKFLVESIEILSRKSAKYLPDPKSSLFEVIDTLPDVPTVVLTLGAGEIHSQILEVSEFLNAEKNI